MHNAKQALIASIAHAAQGMGYTHVNPSRSCNEQAAVVTAYRQEGDRILATTFTADQNRGTGQLRVFYPSHEYPVKQLPKRARETE
ncbi:MAG: hypothetical protein DCC55_39185 [Chloroflexi bacterium]|nr:MAG: hypothetical protein DCC55_39185 [Chloroflexota bacterium]